MGSRQGFIAIAAFTVGLCISAVHGQALKISQVFGGGGNPDAPFNRDYVEIFNAGASDVSLPGWSLQYATSSGSTWQSTPLPSQTIVAGGYFLVQVSSVGTVGAALPQPDHIVSPGISMTSTSGKVALVNGTTALSGACPTGPQIVDLVGFGSAASCYEGSAPAPAPSNTMVLFRGDGGCADTGDNAADFSTGSANPRNSAIARTLCPGADLRVTIEADTSQMTMHNEALFTLRVENLGPDLATDVVLTVQLPTTVSLTSVTPEVLPIDNVLSIPFGDIAAEEGVAATIGLLPYSGTSVVLSASVSAQAPDAKPGNDSMSVALPVFSFTRAKLFVGVKSTAGELRAVDVDSGASKSIVSASISGLAADNENRRFFISDGVTLTILPWDTLTPIVVGSIVGANGNMDGLAWHPSRRRLLGTTNSNIYEIDLDTAAAKLLRAVPGADFGGIDYEVSSNRIVAANNSTVTTGGLSGRGFYRIHPYATDLTIVSAYPQRSPGVPETDIDGCAAGEGRIYGVTDQAEWIYRFQTSSSSFLPPHLQPLTIDHGESGSTFASEFYTQSPGANLGVRVVAPPDCAAADGQPMSFDVVLRNFGPAYAIAPLLSVTLPANTTLIGTSPAMIAAGNVLTLSTPGIGPGEFVTARITIVPVGGSPYTLAATVTSLTSDALPLNNTETRTITTQSAWPAAPAATAVLSTLAGSNGVPNRDGVTFTATSDFGRVVRSPAGNRWMVAASISEPPTTDRVLVRGAGSLCEVVLQEATTPVPDVGLTIGNIEPVYSILDNGDFAFASDLDPLPSSGAIIVRTSGGSMIVVAEQDGWNPPLGGTYGATFGSVSLQNDGSVSFHANLLVQAAASHAYFTDDGYISLAVAQSTVPTGQLAAPVVLESMAAGLTDSQVTWMNAAGNKWCSRGDLTGPTATDICLLVNGEVKIQEGFRIPGSALTSNVSAIHATDMEPVSGDVYCRGSNVDGKDWVWRNGTVIATSAAPISQGQTELFADNVLARCFIIATGNSVGDFVIGGLTNAPNADANEVLVLNNQHVLLRENDVIDIDGNGAPDDDTRIHSFRENSAFLTDDGWLYAVVRVRSGSSVCRGAPAEIGQALIRKRVVCPADFNRDGTASVPDIFAFLGAWFAQSPAADFDGNSLIQVPDIFAFLSAWFAGC